MISKPDFNNVFATLSLGLKVVLFTISSKVYDYQSLATTTMVLSSFFHVYIPSIFTIFLCSFAIWIFKDSNSL